MMNEKKYPVCISRRKNHNPGLPPPGYHLVSDTGAHFDAMTVLEDGTVKFHPTDSALSTTVMSGDHPYVKNLLLERTTSYTMLSTCAQSVKLTGAEKRKIREEKKAKQGQAQSANDKQAQPEKRPRNI